ncbi:hypothetical protein NPIL_295881, partial [Nephila pilipes]
PPELTLSVVTFSLFSVEINFLRMLFFTSGIQVLLIVQFSLLSGMESLYKKLNTTPRCGSDVMHEPATSNTPRLKQVMRWCRDGEIS